MTPYTALSSQPRLPAAELLTLRHPLALYVEVTNRCNFKCPICPVSLPDYAEQAGYHEHMSLAVWETLWKQIYDWQVAEGWDLRVMRFWGLGEPLLHPRLADMIKQGEMLADRRELATNGTMLTCRAQPLIESGLQYLRVSVYGTTTEQYRTETGSHSFRGLPLQLPYVLGEAKEFRRVRDQYEPRTPWITAQLTTRHPDVAEFTRQWTGVADDLRVETLHNWGGSEGRLVQIDMPWWGRKPAVQRLVCSKPFMELTVKSNGDVTPCCLDWNGQMTLGNVLKQELREIWEGERLRDIRTVHLGGKRSKLTLCRDCSQIEQQTDNLDHLVRSAVPFQSTSPSGDDK